MWIGKKINLWSVSGVSVLGGVSHNIGLIIIAAFVVETAGVFYYIPFLLFAGVLTGLLMGLITKLVIPHFERTERTLG